MRSHENFDISVIVCSHNPKPEYLNRTLKGLREQTFPLDRWEFLLVDNGSSPCLSSRFDVSWHPNGRLVEETRLGLSFARLRGFRESSSKLLLFVDDDNVLAPDYLQNTIQIAEEWPKLGTFGGQCIAEYEVPPEERLLPYTGSSLAIRELSEDKWSNSSNFCDTHPYGAGMCVRAEVFADIEAQYNADNGIARLDRRGTELTSHGDYFINRTACRLGLGCGTFQRLKLTHLISASRVTEEYLIRLHCGFSKSQVMLEHLEGLKTKDPLRSFLGIAKFWAKAMLIRDKTARNFYVATKRAKSAAVRSLQVPCS